MATGFGVGIQERHHFKKYVAMQKNSKVKSQKG
jgi:hypothetical protein